MGVLEILNSWNEDLDSVHPIFLRSRPTIVTSTASTATDPRTKDLPLVGSNYQVPLMLTVYLYFVLKWGPSYMKDKQPYDLKTFIRCYNVFQVFVNAFLVVRFAQLGFFNEPTRFWALADYSSDPIAVQISYTIWLGLLSRVCDLAETVTFVLRKKDRQISFLHLYHHVAVVLLLWYITRFYAIHMATVSLLLNSAIHVVMYTYYFLSSYGDKAPKMLQKVKPLITTMQLIQFVIQILHSFVAFLPSCTLKRTTPAILTIIHLTINFVLFLNFYRTNYKTQQKPKK